MLLLSCSFGFCAGSLLGCACSLCLHCWVDTVFGPPFLCFVRFTLGFVTGPLFLFFIILADVFRHTVFLDFFLPWCPWCHPSLVCTLFFGDFLVLFFMQLYFREKEAKGFAEKCTSAKDEALAYDWRLYMSNNNDELKNEIMSEIDTPCIAYPKNTEMYMDLPKTFGRNPWRRTSLACQQVKAVHQRPCETLQPLPIPQWKWEYINCVMYTVGVDP